MTLDDLRQNRQEWKRLRAFEDYYALGPKRSVDGLWKKYVAFCKTNPEQSDEVPTRNRSLMYEWAREDQWELKVAQRELEHNEDSRKRYDRARKRGYDNLALLIDKAVAALDKLTTEGSKEETRLKAAVEILERTGVVKTTQVPEKTVEQAPQASSGPADDATDDDIRKFLATKRQSEQRER